jgi:hypothetical protein
MCPLHSEEMDLSFASSLASFSQYILAHQDQIWHCLLLLPLNLLD